MDVTLIVKASNQQCEDLTIKCEPSWTIRRLKGHLTEVYPGKPSSDEQKLIYSGQLLGDSVVLKDVLRHYDGQQTHTVHLVFTPKNSYYGNSGSGGSSSSSSSSSSASKSSRNGSSGSTSSGMATNPTASTQGNSGPGGSSNSPGGSGTAPTNGGDARVADQTAAYGGDGLRQRSPLQNQPEQNTLPGQSPFMDTAALQSLVQQTYMQYLNQYINLINAQSGSNALLSGTGGSAPGGPATSPNQFTGSMAVPRVPFVPLGPTPAMVRTFPNSSYYACLTGPSYVGEFPPASTIPPSNVASGSVLSGATPGTTFLPSPAVPSSSGTDETGSQPTSSGAASSPSDGGASSLAPTTATTAQAPGTDANAAPPQPQDGVVAEAAAPARARRFPNIVVEEQENNDWLDVFFSMCRVGILMTVIYLYSSPMRCLMVLFIGVMLYLKKHLDRMYQAIDRRLTRLSANPQPNAAAQPQQPGPAVAPPNNNVPEQQANEAPRQPEQPEGAAGDGLPTTERTAADGEVAGPSSSQTAPVPRPRTGPASRAAEAATNAEAEPLLERPLPMAGSDATTAAEQPAAEGQRMTFNDMTSFLGTLVITFFTSIIPDTPAA